jgi:hypothetical protein
MLELNLVQFAKNFLFQRKRTEYIQSVGHLLCNQLQIIEYQEQDCRIVRYVGFILVSILADFSRLARLQLGIKLWYLVLLSFDFRLISIYNMCLYILPYNKTKDVMLFIAQSNFLC